MSDLVIVAVIGAVPATLSAIGVLIANRRLAIVHDAVNGGLKAAQSEIVKLKEALRLARDGSD